MHEKIAILVVVVVVAVPVGALWGPVASSSSSSGVVVVVVSPGPLSIIAKLEKKKFHTYVIVGDGEINEGSFWESSMIASKHKLSNYHIIIDYNKIQSYGQTKDVMQLEPLKDKLSSFG